MYQLKLLLLNLFLDVVVMVLLHHVTALNQRRTYLPTSLETGEKR